jgi:hypothetical protein
MKKYVAIVTCFCFLSLPVAAQERLLPQWEECTVEGERRACYSLEQARELLVLEENARTWRAKLLEREALQIDSRRTNYA